MCLQYSKIRSMRSLCLRFAIPCGPLTFRKTPSPEAWAVSTSVVCISAFYMFLLPDPQQLSVQGPYQSCPRARCSRSHTVRCSLPLEQCCPLPISEFVGFHGYCHSAVAVARGLRTSGLLGGAPKASLLELITQNLAVMQKSWQLLSLHPENRADVSGFLQT